MNTCSVTATADQGARQTIRRIARDNPAARIVVDRLLRDAVRGRRRRAAGRRPRRRATSDKDSLVVGRLRGRRAADGGPRSATATGRAAPIEPGVAGRTAFTLRVQTGCEERCAYCIIPSTRGAVAEPAGRRRRARGRARRGGRLQGGRAHRRAPRIVRARPRRRARRCSICCARSTRRTATSCSASARSSRWTARRRSSISSRRAAAGSRRTSICRCSTRATACSRAMRRPYTLDDYRRLVDGIVARAAARLDRLGHDRRVPGRDRRGLRREPRLPAARRR